LTILSVQFPSIILLWVSSINTRIGVTRVCIRVIDLYPVTELCHFEPLGNTRDKLREKSFLKTAGWDVDDRIRVVEEYDVPTGAKREPHEIEYDYAGHLFCDYVLLGKDGKPLAVVEAKRTSKNAETGREQARQYCGRIREKYSCVLPFCFYTNGLDIFFWDIGSHPPRKVAGLPTRYDLERLLFLREHRHPLADELINKGKNVLIIREFMEECSKDLSGVHPGKSILF
jgi:hypothetical protein